MRFSLAHIVVSATAASAALAVSQAATAADIPRPAVRAPAAVVATTNWTGFYINGGFGYGVWVADTQSVNPLTGTPVLQSMRQGGRGWLGRVGGGYDYQFTPNIVAGVFGDYDFSSLKGTIQDQIPPVTGDIKQDSSWAVGGRIGWLVNPDLLSYFSGGYTQAHYTGANMVTVGGGATPFVTPSFTTNGWFLGGGVETALAPGWFVRTEYRYSQFDRHRITDRFPSGALGPGADITFKPTVQTATTSLVYKFGGGAAPVYQTPPAVAAAWTGLYVNAGWGYGLWSADTTTTLAGGGLPAAVVGVRERQGGRGWLGRVGAGYDYQFTPRIVAGIFGDYDFSSLKGTIQDPDIGVSGEIKQKWSWAAGVRGGWLVNPATMAYVNGGYTSAHFSSAAMNDSGFGFAPAGLSTPSFTKGGWFLGGGSEFAATLLGTGWFWRNEYRYAYYGSVALPDTIPGTAVAFNTINFKPQVQTITTQLVYKFNWTR